MHLPDDLVHAAALPKDSFDGLQLSAEGGVPDASVLV